MILSVEILDLIQSYVSIFSIKDMAYSKNKLKLLNFHQSHKQIKQENKESLKIGSTLKVLKMFT